MSDYKFTQNIRNFDDLFSKEALAQLIKDIADGKVEVDYTRPYSMYGDMDWRPSEKEDDAGE